MVTTTSLGGDVEAVGAAVVRGDRGRAAAGCPARRCSRAPRASSAAAAAARTGRGAGVEGWPAERLTRSPWVRWRSPAAAQTSMTWNGGIAARAASCEWTPTDRRHGLTIRPGRIRPGSGPRPRPRRAQRDVGAVVRAGQVHAVEPPVGVGAGRGQVVAGAHHRQHPAARGHDGAVVAAAGAGVQHALALGAGDDVAQPRRCRGSPRRRRPRSPRRPSAHCERRLRRRASPVAVACSSPASGVRSSGEDDLGLRVAEAAVELDHRGPGRGQRQPGVEQPGERRAAARPAPRRPGATTSRDQLVGQVRRRPRQRRVGAHAAGVRARVSPSPTRLKSCAGSSGTTVVAVDQAEQRHLRPVEVGLEQHRVAAVEQACRRARGRRRGPSVTTTPLPAASPSSLTT